MHKNLTFTHTLAYSVDVAKQVYKGSVSIYTTSKPIELESPGCSGFEENLMSFKT